LISFQAFVCFAIWPWYWNAYRIRGWGRLPKPRGPTLCIANHQHDLDDKVTISYIERGGPWNKTIYTVSGRRLFEPGAFGYHVPWTEPLTRGVDATKLFLAIGMVPIENQPRTRPVAGFAQAVYDRHGDLPLADVFAPTILEMLGTDAQGKTLSYLFGSTTFRRSRGLEVPIKWIHEPYRRELLDEMRVQMDADMRGLETLLASGETFWLTPEGRFSKTGRMNKLREALWRLAPLAQEIYTIAISYDVFVGRRLSMLFRVLPALDRNDLGNSMKAPRPVTVSQLLADYLCGAAFAECADTPFTQAQALDAVRERLAALPPIAWVEPELRASPERMTRAALHGLQRLGIAAATPDGYRLTSVRVDPRFPNAEDILAHQAAFFQESSEAWRVFSAREG